MTPLRPALGLSLALSTLAACSPPDAGPGAPTPLVFSGCRSVLAGPTCEVTPGQPEPLVLWHRAAAPECPAPAAVWVLAGARVLEPEAVDVVDDAVRIRLAAPTEDATLHVASSAGSERCAAWARLDVHAVTPPAWLDEARAQRAAGDLEGAEATVRAAWPGLTDADRGRAGALLARVALARGEHEAAARGLADAAEAQRAAGRIGDALEDVFALSYVEIHHLGASERALERLDAAEREAEAYPDAAMFAPFHRSLLARDQGDLRRALRELEVSARWAERTSRTGMRGYLGRLRALILADLGRYAAAAAALGPLVDADPDDPAARFNLGWVGLAALEAGRCGDRPARPPLPPEELRDVYEAAIRLAPSASQRADAHLGAARAALLSEDLPAAGAHVAEARERYAAPSGHQQVVLAWVEAELAHARGVSSEALAALDELERHALLVGDVGALWRAHADRGRVLAEAGDSDQAVRVLERAEALVTRSLHLVPLGGGRSAFGRSRERSTCRLLELQLRRGDARAALDVARAALSRSARVLAAGHAARASAGAAVEETYAARRAELDARFADLGAASAAEEPALLVAHQRLLDETTTELEAELAAPGPGAGAPGSPPEGELLLVLHPTPGARWVALTLLNGRAAAHRLGPMPADHEAEGWARWLLEPLAAELGSAQRLRVESATGLAHVDVHALPWRGAPLVATLPVVHGVSLPTPPQAPGRRAMVLADPLEDLPSARREAEAVTSALGGWEVTTLVGREAAGDAVREALASADHLHYTGHAVFAGVDGWESGLVLEEAATRAAVRPRRLLGPADVLALPRVPRGVVLSACESAGAVERAAADDLTMARAFVLAGASWAIGTTRTVRDEDARAVAAALYRDGVPSDAAAAAASLARAQSEAAERPRVDWAAYRLIARGAPP